jgi:ribosomal protein L18
MTINRLAGLMVFLVAVLFSYSTVNAQVVDKTKDAASKAADVTVDSAKKVSVVVTDNLKTAADKTGDAASAAAKSTVKSSKTFGSHTVTLVENISGEPEREGGKYYNVSTWDGTKWVSKRTWFPDKKPQ